MNTEVMTMKHLLLLIMMISTSASADWLDIHLTSYHLGHDGFESDNGFEKFNSNNFGIGWRTPVTESVEAIAGGYYNSFSRTSLYGGASLHTPHSDTVSFAIDGGLVSGYKSKLLLFVRPNISMGSIHHRVIFGVIPPGIDSEKPVTVFTLSMALKF